MRFVFLGRPLKITDNMNRLTGHIERITFASDETAYHVCKIKVKHHNDLVTIVGNMVNPLPGEYIEVHGNWTSHPKFGDQFQVRQYKTLVPANQFGIQKYLGSGLIDGIGPVMAKRIVKRFGIKSLEIIEKEPRRLYEIDGIGKKRVKMIQTAWDEQKDVHAVMLFLQSHEISSAYAAKIFKAYGQDTIHIVKENPYRLARDIFGIGFLTADKIAGKLGISKSSPMRIEAGLEYVLNQLADKGHVCYPYQDLLKKNTELLEVEKEMVIDAIGRSQLSDRIVIEDCNKTCDVFKGNNPLVFLKKFFVCETGITENLKRIVSAPKSIRPIKIRKAMEWIKDNIPFRLAKKQETAVKKSLEEKILVVTGGPGTGKTTIINAIIKIFKKTGAKILMAAPTGRAAKRMSEATGEGATTIHRMLDYSHQASGFKKNRKNPLVLCDVLIIDEASMIDTILMHYLLEAVPSSATLILAGDVNQLPSVGPGNVLNDIIASRAFQVVTLDFIFRQAQKSLIVVNAHRINKGLFPVVTGKAKKRNFYFIQKEEPEIVLETILNLVKKRIPAGFGFDPVQDIQVLTPMHKGIVGTANLNRALQELLNPDNVSIQSGNWIFKRQDKVMQIRNNYDKNTYNGDIGTITKIDLTHQNMRISFNERHVEYGFSNLDELVPAYAVSIHKSQGSEYPAVIIPVVTQHYVLLQRNLIYTAITRGEKLVILVGTKKALAMAIHTVKSLNRHTRLRHRLEK